MSRNHTWVADPLANSLMAEYSRRSGDGPTGHWGRYVGVQDRGVAAAYDVEVAALLRDAPTLEEAVSAACEPDDRGKQNARARDRLLDRLDHELRNGQSHVRFSLEALLSVDDRASVSDEPTAPAGSGHVRQRGKARMVGGPLRGSVSARRVFVPLLRLNAIIAVVLAAGPVLSLSPLGTPPPAGDGLTVLLSACAVWALAFMPGWLFVRFLDRRAGALWDEYVIHLHRLRVDDPGNLPEPPSTSSYHKQWLVDGGVGRLRMRNIYREKFDAYYGRSVSRFGTDLSRPVQPEALFPVFLCTALLAVAWTAVLYDPQPSFGSTSAPTTWTALSFAFIGAYVFFLQMLLRRYFQTDLRAGAYVSGYVRVVAAMLIVVVVHAAMPGQTPGNVVIAVAFVIGWFPNAGVQWLVRIASRRLRGTVTSLEPAYPLNRLDGLNIWYETRLLEEGIEDLENLVTAKLVDVLLHTRVPVARLVDWVDQALLLIHLPAEPSVVDQVGRTHKKRLAAAAKQGDQHERLVLRGCGIRSATGLLRALHSSRDQAERDDLLAYLGQCGLPRSRVLTLRAVLERDPRLGAIYNWQGGDVAPRPPLPLVPVSATWR